MLQSANPTQIRGWLPLSPSALLSACASWSNTARGRRLDENTTIPNNLEKIGRSSPDRRRLYFPEVFTLAYGNGALPFVLGELSTDLPALHDLIDAAYSQDKCNLCCIPDAFPLCSSR